MTTASSSLASVRSLLLLATGVAALAACAQGTVADSGFMPPHDGGGGGDAHADGTPAMDAPPPNDTFVPPVDVPTMMEAGPECTTSADCAARAGRPVCNPATGTCVACTAMDDRCPTGQRCDATNTCVAGCRSDMDCMGASTRCDMASHMCVGCTADTDCALGSICRMGACVAGCNAAHGCNAGRMCCSGTCADLQADPMNCGGCGMACGAGGMCCAGTCASTMSDPRNCGGCGNVCALPRATANCTAGACTVAMCTFGFGDCDSNPANGCETTLSDNTNCGVCGRACGAGTTCMGGTCAPICAPGLTFCSGACVNTSSDPANCGACGRVCGAGMSCSAGACGIICSAGLTLCGTTCVNLTTDPANCGACGRVCGAGTMCSAGACVSSGPANDTCAGASAITVGAGTVTVTGSTATATHDSSCGGAPDVWYRFTLAQTELVYFDAFGSGYDTELGIYSGCGAAPVSCNDDACGVLQSQVTAVLGAGTYYLSVGGFSSNSGPYTVHFQHVPVPTGSSAAGALISGSSSVSGSTAGAPSFGVGCGFAGSTVWYQHLSCPGYGGGTFTATTCSHASFDTVLAIRNGDGAGGGCNDDSCGLQSTVTGAISAGPGVQVFFVSSYNTASGPFTGVTYTMP